MTIDNFTKTNRIPLSEAITGHFTDFQKRNGEADGSLLPFCEKHLFFITVMFHQGSVGVTSSSQFAKDRMNTFEQTSVWDEFGRSYFAMSRFLLRSNLGSKRDRQPLTYAFLDYNGTRRSSGSDGSNLHIHALMLVHPSTMDLFNIVRVCPDQFKTNRMRDFMMSRFDSSKSSLNDLITYVSKGFMKSTGHDRDEYWNIFPRGTHEAQQTWQCAASPGSTLESAAHT